MMHKVYLSLHGARKADGRGVYRGRQFANVNQMSISWNWQLRAEWHIPRTVAEIH